MKNLKYVFLSSMAVALSFSVSACGNNPGGDEGPTAIFSYDLVFDTGKEDRIFFGESEVLSIIEQNAPAETEYTWSYASSSDANYFTVEKNKDGKSFTITPTAVTPVVDGVAQKVGIRIKEKSVAGTGKKKSFSIGQRFPTANTGYNFSADTEAKEEALGKLEGYAMKNYLTGISLFENGGYQRFSARVEDRAPSYVSGYGFGILTEGKLNPEKPLNGLDPNDQYKDYYRTATSSNPGNINGWKATGSQIGDLFGYITSSFYGTKLNKAKTGYVWYPILANDPDYREDLDNAGPVAQDGKPTDTIHKKWRIYVKTGSIKYRSLDGNYDNRPVTLDDYIQTFKVLLTQKTQLVRGSELATDTSYGFKGAISYFRNTKDATDAQAETAWDDMVSSGRLGIVGGNDDDGKGDYIDFEFVNPVDQFTAMYTLSSSLYSPMPKAFLESIGGGSWITGAGNFGTKNGSNVKNNVINLGPYFLKEWDTQEIVFTQNRDWFEYIETKDTDRPRYRIPGVHMLVVEQAQQKDDAIFNEFNNDKLDSTGIPASRFSEKVGTDVPTKGDATFKLNVNACTEERWDELFWTPGKYPDVSKPTTKYAVKKWMSNTNFLNGLFWSIDRETFANNRGVNPSYNYFADAYLSDPRGGTPYNTTQAHKDAEDAFDPVLRSSGTYGYSKAKASSYFDRAVKELQLPLGTKSRPTYIDIDISWMYTNDETTYGQEIANYFTDAFNNENVGSGCIQLRVNHPTPGSDWQDVYNNHLMVGHFDLGFGAISGNTLSPLNFMEVLKSDNSSGFTLNWGADTAKVDDNNPITFDVPVLDEEGNVVTTTDPVTGEKTPVKETKEWSYDALWAAADHGSVVRKGQAVDTVDHGYVTIPKKQGENINFLNEGGEMDVPFSFVKIDKAGASFEIKRVQLFLLGYGYLVIDPTYISYTYDEDGDIDNIHINFDSSTTYITMQIDKTDPVTHLVIFDPETGLPVKETVDFTFAEYVNYLLFSSNNFQKIINDNQQWLPDQSKFEPYLKPFAYANYDLLWNIEIAFEITIKGSVPTESSYTVALMNDNNNSALRFAKA